MSDLGERDWLREEADPKELSGGRDSVKGWSVSEWGKQCISLPFLGTHCRAVLWQGALRFPVLFPGLGLKVWSLSSGSGKGSA